MKTFKEELIELMKKHKQLDKYTNPHLIVGILNTLEEVSGKDVEDELWDWVKDNWGR